MKPNSLRLALAFALLTPVLRAHSVWIEETPAKQLVVRFGEPGADVETSPGYLDQLALPVAWKSGAEGKPLHSSSRKSPIIFFSTTPFPPSPRSVKPFSP